MGKTRHTKAKIRTLNKTTEGLPNSQEPGQTCETKTKNPTETPKTATPFSAAGFQYELEFGDVASLSGGQIAGESKGDYLSPGLEISEGVSHAEGQGGNSHLDENKQDELMGVTTLPRGKRREQCEVPITAASDFNLEDSQIGRAHV